MKRMMIAIIFAILAVSIVGCSSDDKKEIKQNQQESKPENETDSVDSTDVHDEAALDGVEEDTKSVSDELSDDETDSEDNIVSEPSEKIAETITRPSIENIDWRDYCGADGVLDFSAFVEDLGYEIVDSPDFPEEGNFLVFYKGNQKYYVINAGFSFSLLFNTSIGHYNVGLGEEITHCEDGVDVKSGKMPVYRRPEYFLDDISRILKYLITTDEIDIYNIPTNTSYHVMEYDWQLPPKGDVVETFNPGMGPSIVNTEVTRP